MRPILDTLGAVYQLARLAVVTRFRFGGPYWRWRLHTAFGTAPPSLTAAQKLHSVLDYGRWIHRMRRGM